HGEPVPEGEEPTQEHEAEPEEPTGHEIRDLPGDEDGARRPGPPDDYQGDPADGQRAAEREQPSFRDGDAGAPRPHQRRVESLVANSSVVRRRTRGTRNRLGQ